MSGTQVVGLVGALVALAGGPGVAAASGLKANAPFSPAQEIQILDPNVDPLGNPAVRPVPRGDGTMAIDVPATVIVHKYYYSGDRSFRGPFIPGGPSVIVASHSRSGERVYVNAQMFPGFPTVSYTSSAIKYDYGPQSVEVCFRFLKPRVVYCQGTKAGVTTKNVLEKMGTSAKNLYVRSDVPVMAERLKTGTKNLVLNAADATRQVSETVRAPVVNAVMNLPGLGNLFASPEPQAVRQEEVGLARQQAQFQRGDAPFPPSNTR